MQKEQGFTLVELVVVIIIIGVLSVTAAPKFINLASDARVATLLGIRGAINSANVMIYSKAILSSKHKLPNAVVDVNSSDDSIVPIKHGYLAADSLALQTALNLDNDDWVFRPGMQNGDRKVIKIYHRDVDLRQCFLTYTEASINNVPIVSRAPSANDC